MTGTTTSSIYPRAAGRPGVLTDTSELLRPPLVITGPVTVELSTARAALLPVVTPGTARVTTKAGTAGIADPTLAVRPRP